MSGYGCYCSGVGKACESRKQVFKWMTIKIVNLLVVFFISFFVVTIVRYLILPDAWDFDYIAKSFLSLAIPGSTTWYLKVQILYYLILVFDLATFKRHGIITVIGCVIYSIVAMWFQLPSQWWLTSMCFPAGVVVAMTQKHWAKVSKRGLTIVSILALIGGVISVYIIPSEFQILSYAAIAAGSVFVVSVCNFNSTVFAFLGHRSFEVYLVHIGLVELVLTRDININIRIGLFLGLSLSCALIVRIVRHMLFDHKLKI